MRQSKTFLLVIGMLTISVATAMPGPAAPYSTQLFSLLTNGSSPVDGKNHYQKEFDQQFDAMLAQSALAKAAKPGVPLKQRLMSGPQPEPLTLQDKAGGQQYVYYEACQAHACDDTSLVVLYAPASRAHAGPLAPGWQGRISRQPICEGESLAGPGQTYTTGEDRDRYSEL